MTTMSEASESDSLFASVKYFVTGTLEEKVSAA